MTHFSTQTGLNLLAHQTGGIFFHDTMTLLPAAKKIMEDQNGYYLIGYQPEEGTFEHAKDPRFHRWTVRVTKPGLVVRTRSGFLA